jgi:subtilisin-like proprotein convertase family protein
MNWDTRTRHTPSRIGIAGNLIQSCNSGSGPCGKEVHCEGYLIGETIYDLAARDFPAQGYDAATSWFLTDRLWYQSRLGSGGPMYTCTAGSGGCAATSVFARMRAVDDDDGNLANGTPHAAAIFAAFARHDIACGLASDASNQSTAFPPVVTALSLSGTGSTNSAILSINHTSLTPDTAASFRILRNDTACDYNFTVVGTAAGSATTYTDTGLPNGFPLFYRVQAVGANPAHESALSNCVMVTPQPFAGTVVLNQGAYSCAASIGITVVDGNIPGSTINVAIRSTTEGTPENVVLTQVTPGDPTYSGSIATTAGAPSADGLLSVSAGDTITVDYVDADDGNGGLDVPHEATADVDCTAPAISAVQASNVAGKSALITWSTDEASNSRVHYGPAPTPGASATVPALVTGHSVPLSGLLECTDYVFSVESTDDVGNAAADDNGGSYFTFTTGLDTSPSFASSGPVSIPDNNAGGGASVINVPTARPIADVDVVVNIDHNSSGQLVLSLQPPSGPAITLSNRRGGTADDFVNTIFDDEATNPISGGTAPFTGRFRPDSPLSSTDGILANGDWTLRAVDAVSGTVGTILNWTLAVTFPNQSCGPHAQLDGHTTVADICASGGAGGDGIWDGGETVQLSVDLWNDGTETLTGVSATLTSPTPGVQVLDGTAAYPNLVALSGSPSTGPHFTIQVPSGAACNSDLALDVQIDSDQGTWNGSFTHKVGFLQTANTVAFSENFSGGIPAGWTVVDGGTGGGAAATWTTANPGNRTFLPPMVAPVAVVDSDFAGSGGPTQDEQLITPVIDLSGALSVTLVYDQFFRWFAGSLDEKGDVDVRSSLTGGNWVNVFRNQGASSPNPDHRSIDITTHAAGAADVQIRFHYYDAQFEWFWWVDNIRLDIVIVPACLNTVCEAAATANPVASLTASRADASTIDVVWDAATCASTDYELLYGSLSDLPTYAPLGSVCGLGPSGSSTWSSVPAGDLWFVVTGIDNAGTEASWGQATAGERNGTSASGLCGSATRDNAPCP